MLVNKPMKKRGLFVMLEGLARICMIFHSFQDELTKKLMR